MALSCHIKWVVPTTDWHHYSKLDTGCSIIAMYLIWLKQSATAEQQQRADFLLHTEMCQPDPCCVLEPCKTMNTITALHRQSGNTSTANFATSLCFPPSFSHPLLPQISSNPSCLLYPSLLSSSTLLKLCCFLTLTHLFFIFHPRLTFSIPLSFTSLPYPQYFKLQLSLPLV